MDLAFFIFIVIAVPAFMFSDGLKWHTALALLLIPVSFTTFMLIERPSFNQFGKLYLFLIAIWAIYLHQIIKNWDTLWSTNKGPK